MKSITKVTRIPRVLAVLTAATIGLSSVSTFAADSGETGYDNITVLERVSAHGARRLARQFLVERGFATGVGPGKAAIKSVTREGDTWILRIRMSDSGWVMNRSAVLYIDAKSAIVSEIPPERMPQQVAAQ